MKNRRGKLYNAKTPITIPRIDFIREELKKDATSLTVDHARPNVNIQENQRSFASIEKHLSRYTK
ncbi:hypothetical protein [Peribacillus frigoritolerans]|uniref:hypothetical protein n=1 Tax=Peribacillus castrilensis TaxID=2897690 RepID=UPI00296E37DC|nr:hypothetical protein [Peribacillus castrilensis]